MKEKCKHLHNRAGTKNIPCLYADRSKGAIMKPFMDKDFLLSTDTARTLFHEIAEKMPVLDYHCHINPQEIAEDRKFENIT